MYRVQCLYIYEWASPENETDPEKKVRVDTCGHKANATFEGFEVTSHREYPHMALLGRKNPNNTRAWVCGGTLISEQFVMTSVICAHSKTGEIRWVRLGEHSLDTPLENGIQDFGVDEIIRHPNFKYVANKRNNIALVRLDRRAILNKFVIPACLHTEYEVEQETAMSTGWGSSGKDGVFTSDLSKVVLEIFPTSECNATYAYAFNEHLPGIDESMICAGHRTLKLTCPLHAGEPLQVYLKEPYCMYDLIGVNSFDVDCSRYVGVPDVYNRVSYYLGWIESVVWPN